MAGMASPSITSVETVTVDIITTANCGQEGEAKVILHILGGNVSSPLTGMRSYP